MKILVRATQNSDMKNRCSNMFWCIVLNYEKTLNLYRYYTKECFLGYYKASFKLYLKCFCSITEHTKLQYKKYKESLLNCTNGSFEFIAEHTKFPIKSYNLFCAWIHLLFITPVVGSVVRCAWILDYRHLFTLKKSSKIKGQYQIPLIEFG